MTLTRSDFAASWRSWYARDMRRSGPAWMQWLWTGVFSVAVAMIFTVLGFVTYPDPQPDAWRNGSAWLHRFGANLGIAFCIGITIHLLFSILKALIGAERLRATPLRRRLFFITVPLVGVVIGLAIGLSLFRTGAAPGHVSSPNAVVGSLLVTVLATLGFYHHFNLKAREIQAERRAAEARLRLLQGQIEPHFLFNTLANVAALIDTDGPRARRMLESLTDYLRGSLGALRDDRATLGSELELVDNYLSLLKVRMEDRLQFSVDADPALRDVRLPPLLLQPLVENAIHHGLEPKIDGGSVRIGVRRDGSALVIAVADDGLGLTPTARHRRGAGVALANLRERLSATYGSAASLQLVDTAPGATATLRVPLERAA